MGSWGLGTFDDDIACDWLEDLHDSDPIAFFTQCLDLTGHDDLEYLACVGVVCTAEILHAVLAEPREGLPAVARQWIGAHRQLEALPLAAAAISGLRRVICPSSEMHQLWEDNEKMHDAWMRQIKDLLTRLEATMARNA
jgi:hypothetical protein